MKGFTQRERLFVELYLLIPTRRKLRGGIFAEDGVRDRVGAAAQAENRDLISARLEEKTLSADDMLAR